MGDTNILNYQAKSEAARSVEELIGKIDSAHHQWNTYGVALSLSFKKAYEEHEKTLKEVENSFRSESSELMYYILAAFVVGAAGGIAGLLITPILNEAGSYIGRRMLAQTNRKVERMRRVYSEPLTAAMQKQRQPRALDAVEKQQVKAERVHQATTAAQTTVLEGTKEIGVKAAEKLELEKFFAPDPPKPDGAFKPPETDPHKFDLMKRLEIGICASILKENVRRFQFLADEGSLTMTVAREFHEGCLASAFLNDQPTEKAIAAAASETARKHAELAMWIAWATARDTEYWRIRLQGVQHVDRGVDYQAFNELKKYDPVFDRLIYCDVGNLVNMPYTVAKEWAWAAGGHQGQVLSIPKLQQLGKKSQNRFLKRVDNIVRQGRMTVTDLEAIANTRVDAVSGAAP